MEKKALSSVIEGKLDSGEKWIGKRPLSSRFSGCKVGVELGEGGNTLGTLDSAGVMEGRGRERSTCGTRGQ